MGPKKLIELVISGEVAFCRGSQGVLPGRSPPCCSPGNSSLMGVNSDSWDRLKLQSGSGSVSVELGTSDSMLGLLFPCSTLVWRVGPFDIGLVGRWDLVLLPEWRGLLASCTKPDKTEIGVCCLESKSLVLGTAHAWSHWLLDGFQGSVIKGKYH